ncbi:hypothetical protein BCF44_114253 [Kutzneria buriramensis]|uniref:Uncharacterized protein n=1 Tax=Kutzneria buriramensis TaxID=1045776 RepID=A0A3E0H4T8_9PSEU|nr:hypothetical protein BCF44_114253 [Kutzneria buriramensis]
MGPASAALTGRFAWRNSSVIVDLLQFRQRSSVLFTPVVNKRPSIE